MAIDIGLLTLAACLGPDLQNILRQSYDYLMIMPKLRSTYDGRLISKHVTMNGKLFIGKIHVQNRNIVGYCVRKLAYDIPERNFSTFQVTIVSRSYDKLTIIV